MAAGKSASTGACAKADWVMMTVPRMAPARIVFMVAFSFCGFYRWIESVLDRKRLESALNRRRRLVQAAFFLAWISLRLIRHSAIWIVFSAAPLRRLSETHHKTKPLSTVGSSRTRLI